MWLTAWSLTSVLAAAEQQPPEASSHEQPSLNVTVELFERYSIEVMAGGFVWGYPGETDGLGGYVGIGGGISF